MRVDGYAPWVEGSFISSEPQAARSSRLTIE